MAVGTHGIHVLTTILAWKAWDFGPNLHYQLEAAAGIIEMGFNRKRSSWLIMVLLDSFRKRRYSFPDAVDPTIRFCPQNRNIISKRRCGPRPYI